jgi:hypothetical protein
MRTSAGAELGVVKARGVSGGSLSCRSDSRCLPRRHAQLRRRTPPAPAGGAPGGGHPRADLPRSSGARIARLTRPRAGTLSPGAGQLAWRDHHLSIGALWEPLDDGAPFEAGAALRISYRLYAARFGKQRWGDSTHRYGYHMGAVADDVNEMCLGQVLADLVAMPRSWAASRTVGRPSAIWKATPGK